MPRDLPDNIIAKVAVIFRRHLEKRNAPTGDRSVSKPRPAGKREEVFSDVQR